jgi:hypothetical protein
VDYNNDGKLDLLSGDSNGKVWIFINKGTPKEPILEKGVQVESAGTPIVGEHTQYEKDSKGQYRAKPSTSGKISGVYSKLHFADWDGDGLKDLLIGQDGPTRDLIVWYKNIGTKEAPKFEAPKPIALPTSNVSMMRLSPYLIDWDKDGKMDLLCGAESSPKVLFFRNDGTANVPKLEAAKPIELKGDTSFEKGYRNRFDVVDWNNDGKLDLLIGNISSEDRKSTGNVWLFLQE